MTEKKMTEAEIMKALECCKTNDYDYCSKCPLFYDADCVFPLATNCLDLINRKNAEIERLKSMNQAKLDMMHDLREELETNDKAKAEVLGLQKEIKTARAEAIKEVLERVEKCKFPNPMTMKGTIIYGEEFDQIAKEMGVEL